MMAERHRLRDLKMREARHDTAGMFVGARQQSGLNRSQPRVDARARGAHPQAEVGRDLVVARTRGVEAAGGFADQRLAPRSEERRVRRGCVRTCRSGWSPAELTKKKLNR